MLTTHLILARTALIELTVFWMKVAFIPLRESNSHDPKRYRVKKTWSHNQIPCVFVNHYPFQRIPFLRGIFHAVRDYLKYFPALTTLNKFPPSQYAGKCSHIRIKRYLQRLLQSNRKQPGAWFVRRGQCHAFTTNEKRQFPESREMGNLYRRRYSSTLHRDRHRSRRPRSIRITCMPTRNGKEMLFLTNSFTVMALERNEGDGHLNAGESAPRKASHALFIATLLCGGGGQSVM